MQLQNYHEGGDLDYLRLEGCIMSSPHVVHCDMLPSPFRQANNHLVQFWGVL